MKLFKRAAKLDQSEYDEKVAAGPTAPSRARARATCSSRSCGS